MSKKRRASTPIGGGGAGNAASLANLVPGGVHGGFAPGEGRPVTHGLRSRRPLPVGELSDEMAAIVGALTDSAPVRDPDGALPAADEAAVERAARALHRARKAQAWGDATGRFDERTGDPKPITRYELACDQDLDRALTALGMTPDSRYRMLGSVAPAVAVGLDPASVMSAARAEPDPELRRAMLVRGGIIDADDTGADDTEADDTDDEGADVA